MAGTGRLHFSSEDELLSNTGSDGLETSPAPRRGVFIAFGAIALGACGALAYAFSGQTQQQPLNARMLLEDPDVHEMAARNVLKVGEQMMGGVHDEQQVRRLTTEVLMDVSKKLPAEDAVALEGTPITVQQKAEFVRLMSYLSDPRTHTLGIKVAHAVRDADSEDPEVLKVHIAEKLAPHLAELKHLHDEMYPSGSELSKLVDDREGAGFESLLTKKRIQLMKTVDDGWDVHFGHADGAQWNEALTARTDRRLAWGFATPPPATFSWGTTAAPSGGLWGKTSSSSGWGSGGTSQGQAAITQAANNKGLQISKSAIGIIGAVLTEATCMLRVIRPMAKVFGHDLNVNPAITTGLGAGNYAFELAACWVDAAVDGGNPLEVMACPMEFGSELMDAGRELFTLLGILGDNNPANGVQGNHAGNATVSSGLLSEFFDD